MIRPISFGTRLGLGFPGHAVREPDEPEFAAVAFAELPLDPAAGPEAPPLVAPELLA
jgi:hypothetical protein